MRQWLGTLVVLSLLSTSARAATFDYPDVNPPCNTTLQTCVTGVAAGSVVQIVTNAPISESLTVTQSLTLTAGAGFTPVLNGFQSFQGGATATSHTISGLTINGTLSTRQLGAGAYDAHIIGNTINNPSSFGVGIELDSNQSPPNDQVTFEVRANDVTVTGSSPSDQCHGILQGGLPGSGSGTSTIVGNRLTVTNCGQGSAIEVDPAPGESVIADIIGNQVVATNTNDGILVRNFASTPTSLTSRIVNNVVTGETAQAGLSAAIGVSADGSQPISVQLINNTVAFNEVGIALSARTDLGANITGVVANNIAAHNHGSFGTGIGIDPTVSATNDHNLVFDNDSNGFTPGPGTVTADPLFVSATDFHLLSGSPAINAGNNADVPPDVTTDIDGNPRIQRGVVDIGAYETAFAPPAVPAAPIPAASPAGLLLLAALLAGSGWLARRRA